MFEFDILENNNYDVVKIGKKIYYNLDDEKPLGNWVRKNSKKNKIVDRPLLSSALKVKDVGLGRGQENSLGYIYYCGNNIQSNTNGVCLVSSVFSHGHGLNIFNESFTDICVGFSVRKLIQQNWLNEKDEYLEPNENNEKFENFRYDSIICGLFNNSSEQSSLRQIVYKEKLWDIKNEFFWMSKEEMLNLSNENNYSDLYNDARTDSDRYVYKLLFGEERIYDKLSPDAKLVLDKATELVRKSMSMREIFATDENHLKSWDAGYAQLKLLWKEHYEDDFKEFRQMYKNLEDRMRPLVYELGFLMK